MRRIYLLLLTLTGVGQVGCNTFEGVGQDVEQAGEAITDLADDAEDELE